MKKFLLPTIKSTDSRIIATFSIEDLVKADLNLDANFSVMHNFIYQQEINKGLFMKYMVTRSQGSYQNIEAHVSLFSRDDDSLNIHLSHEIGFSEINNKVYFYCPFSDDEISCERLYLREEFPFFASATFLNIEKTSKLDVIEGIN